MGVLAVSDMMSAEEVPVEGMPSLVKASEKANEWEVIEAGWISAKETSVSRISCQIERTYRTTYPRDWC